MTDLYFDDYVPGAKEGRGTICCGSVVILCVIIIGFILFFWIYTYIWENMVASLSSYSLEFVSLGVIIAVILVVYVVRNKSLEKQKILAAS
ncbi:MAG: hypothetical protein RTV41_10000 [Candidatus Thorarchaeota archaeon]